jgi:hypothetical protein
MRGQLTTFVRRERHTGHRVELDLGHHVARRTGARIPDGHRGAVAQLTRGDQGAIARAGERGDGVTVVLLTRGQQQRGVIRKE